MRRIRAVVSLSVVLTTAAACGGTAQLPLLAPTPAATPSSPPTTLGLESKYPADVYAEMRKAYADVTSVHVVGAQEGEDGAPELVTADLGPTEGHLTYETPGSTPVELLTVDGVNYVKGPPEYYEDTEEDFPDQLADRWLSFSASDVTVQVNAVGFADETFPEASDLELTLGTGSTDGRPVVILRFRNGETLEVANTDRPLPLVFHGNDGDLTFSAYDAPLDLSAPPDPVPLDSPAEDASGEDGSTGGGSSGDTARA